MPHARVNGLDIYHETFGDPADPTLALVPGLGTQAVEWDAELCGLIADAGFHVVRFDNRDVGLSTHLDDQVVDVMAVFAAVAAGEGPQVPYLLTDMAADVVGLLDHLGVERAHVCGMSMGGMIAQTIAIEHPDRVLSLTSIMSTTGDPDVGSPIAGGHGRPAVAARHHPRRGRRPQGPPRARVGQPGVRRRGPPPPARRRAVRPGARPAGHRPPAGRHRGLRQPVRRRWPRWRCPRWSSTAPTTAWSHRSGGERTAEVVPDAKLLLVEGMGHDLPPQLWPLLADAVVAHMSENPGA